MTHNHSQLPEVLTLLDTSIAAMSGCAWNLAVHHVAPWSVDAWAMLQAMLHPSHLRMDCGDLLEAGNPRLGPLRRQSSTKTWIARLEAVIMNHWIKFVQKEMELQCFDWLTSYILHKLRGGSLQRLPSPLPSSARHPQWHTQRTGAQRVSSSGSGSRKETSNCSGGRPLATGWLTNPVPSWHQSSYLVLVLQKKKQMADPVGLTCWSQWFNGNLSRRGSWVVFFENVIDQSRLTWWPACSQLKISLAGLMSFRTSKLMAASLQGHFPISSVREQPASGPSHRSPPLP